MAINTSGITTPIATFAPVESPESDGIGDGEGEDVGVFVFVGVALVGVCVGVCGRGGWGSGNLRGS